MRRLWMFVAVGALSFGLLTPQAFAKDLDRLDRLDRLDKLDQLEERLDKLVRIDKLEEINGIDEIDKLDKLDQLEAFEKEFDVRIDLPIGVSKAVDVK